ncbi:LysM peptidoglycan-binding domain-containing protein [Celeribacter litoreus]|uniref:LysM peptidoglycan-binding domain-containing protein n=1 Tax=Celeribacter litoreus TaxID=2876714 RepID=UPI001CD00316|nr:LysM peptidoglycan-binding domain-containing protein [Celeribacter litoreus]MCA0043754.1 LysM peptidoglycan-binding domain-containing protein [Celeribacter litoreus]
MATAPAEVTEATEVATESDETAVADTEAAPAEETAAAVATPEAETEVAETGTPAENAQEDVATETAMAEVESVAASDATPAPSFDLVRIPPEGVTTVAGRAAPGANVRVLVDGETIAETNANVMGEFVMLFDLPSDPVPREMQLETEIDGETQVSEQTVIIAAVDPALMPEETDTAEASSDADVAMALEGEVSEEVEAAPAPTVLMADDEGLKVLQQDGTSPTQLRIDAVTYDPEGGVFVSGRAAPETTLRFYLDDAFLGETEVAVSGQWREELVDIAAGRYLLRVDQVDEDGTVITRAEIPFQREEIADLVAIAEGEDASEASSEDEVAEMPETATTETAEAETSEAPDQKPQKRIASVTVQPGNTLWGIASANYGDGNLYVRVFNANRDQIRNPDLIYPGQIFQLPE